MPGRTTLAVVLESQARLSELADLASNLASSEGCMARPLPVAARDGDGVKFADAPQPMNSRSWRSPYVTALPARLSSAKGGEIVVGGRSVALLLRL